MRRLRIIWTSAAVLAFIGPLASLRAEPPKLDLKTIYLITPYAPGGTSDIAIRRIVQQASKTSGINIVIESKSGGGGAVAASYVKSSSPDGSTLMLVDAGTFAYNVTINPRLPYNPQKDFEPVAMLWAVPNMLAVPSSSPAHSIKELLAYGKKKPGGLTFASQSIGSTGHILGSILSEISGEKMVHVPYRGAMPAAQDLAAGRADFMFSSYPTFRGLIDGGKLRLIANTANRRDPNYPNVPTVAEEGYPQLKLEIWFGLAAPAKTPPATVEALNALFVGAAKTPELKDALAKQGIFVKTDSPAQFKKQIADDIAKYRPIIEKAGAVIK